MKNTIKVSLLSLGVKIGLGLMLRSAAETLIKEGDSKGTVIGIACMVGAAYFAGCVVADDILEKVYQED